MTQLIYRSVSFFFFSSRRRHTRWPRDWSSDVCSSDLSTQTAQANARIGAGTNVAANRGRNLTLGRNVAINREIGRASCRERVYISVVAVSLKKKKVKMNVRSKQ